MKPPRLRLPGALLLAGCLFVAVPAMPVAAAPAAASKHPAAPIPIPAPVRVEAAWVRAAPPGTMVLAGYMTLYNDSPKPERLVSARSDVFGLVELHRSLVVNGMSTMRAAGPQDIPPGGSLRFAPGGLHWMLMQPARDVNVGDLVHFTLQFADGSVVETMAAVKTTGP